MNKKSSKPLICLILFLLVFTGYGKASSLSLSAELKQEICQFVQVIYQDYSRGDFSTVYQKLHPLIKEELAEEVYINFQKDNFQKYQIKISNISVENPVYLTKLPPAYNKYEIKEMESVFLAVTVSYQIEFSHLGTLKQENVQKEVYLARQEEGLSLLWDPSVIDQNRR